MIEDRDAELIAQVRANIRAEGRKFWSLLIAVLAISVLFIGILEFHLPLQSTGLAALVVLVVWIAVMFRLSGSARPVAGPYSEEILRKTIDDQHHRWRWIYAFEFIMVGGLAAMITGLVLFLAAHPPARAGAMASILVVVVDIAVFAIAVAFQVCFGPGFLKDAYRRALNDEHTRALQSSAAMFGYLLCVVMMCAVLVAMVIHPQWALAIMPGAVAVSVILPGLYFLVRQWRAGRDG
jgi:hypothetical protein